MGPNGSAGVEWCGGSAGGMVRLDSAAIGGCARWRDLWPGGWPRASATPAKGECCPDRGDGPDRGGGGWSGESGEEKERPDPRLASHTTRGSLAGARSSLGARW